MATEPYAQLKLKPRYRALLGLLADEHKRSLANMVEVLIDEAVDKAAAASRAKRKS